MHNFEQLRKDIKEGQVLLPGDQGYQEGLQRWSAACVKNAVSFSSTMHHHENH